MAERIISAQDAIAQGLKFYFTGVPCKHGHVAPRRVTRRDCYQCKKDSERRRIDGDPEKHKIRRSVARERDREKYKAKYRISYASNPERWKARNRKWRELNPERHAEITRQKSARWRERHPEQTREMHKASGAKRRAQKRRSEGNGFTRSDVREILKLQKRRCAYCREKLTKRYHVDHIVPLARGGTNDRRNIQITCETCNLRKNSKDPIVFAQSLGMLL